jgi:hypothetical protein
MKEVKNMITVKQLREQLETLEKMGMGDAVLWFRGWDDIDHPLEEGIYDTCGNDVALG